eukprot:5893046-Amphidinium_carterae.1
MMSFCWEVSTHTSFTIEVMLMVVPSSSDGQQTTTFTESKVVDDARAVSTSFTSSTNLQGSRNLRMGCSQVLLYADSLLNS